MVKGYPVLLSVHPVSFDGATLLGDQWEGLLAELRRGLATGGLEARDSLSELMLFNFDHPLTALATLFEQLDKLRKKFPATARSAKLPLQFVLHLESKNESPPSFRYPGATVWEELEHHAVYLSPALAGQWEKILTGRADVPQHELQSQGRFAKLIFSQPAALRRRRLFPYRAVLAEAGTGRPCFYCGLRTHPSSLCPAKQLSMAGMALHDVGYQPLDELLRNFQAAFSNRKQMEALLGPGVDQAQLRKNPALQAYVAFFDLLIVYQPRYLQRVVFSVHSLWSGLNLKVRTKQDSRNLEIGLDCLRVGQYDRARDILLAENQALGGKQYGANVGLAFVALEQGRFEEMGHFLEIAASVAEVEKEKIHSALLLARYHDLAGNSWKAEQALQGMANLYADCYEIIHRRIHTAVRGGHGAQVLGVISGLIESSRLYFMNVLMDPVLLPVEGLLEDVLNSHLRTTRSRADEALAGAVVEYEKLKKWVDGKDEEFDRNLETLTSLQQQVEKGSYYDLLDVVEKANSLRRAAPRLQESKLDELNDEIDEAVLEWDKFQQYWQEYAYKSFWRRAERQMQGVRNLLVEARGTASSSLHQGRTKLQAARRELESWPALIKRMNRLRLLLDSLRIFAGRLVVAEVVVSVLLLIAYPVLTVGLADQIGPDLVARLKDSAMQKRLIFTANGVVAPVIAFAQTVRRVVP
ncbi:hypothetical protein [Desulfurivibrio dismutans]|uniref:hypothetical protein n=1 Tax=Desulfurivibrio dismutans TaxID=1398908 RepID=UPI0023DB578E|nr:hypothetical protein [Desulfurivibrio alkaliphilus]MDF1615337.1 hypothetical protein [Desulfurivibrio alkaliphilus]